MFPPPGIRRTLSSCDVNSSLKIHERIKFLQDGLQGKRPKLNYDVTKSSMVLPKEYDEREYTLIVNLELLRRLEGRKILNWSMLSRPLVPIHTDVDVRFNNTLLHSVSLYVFGVHDRYNVFRQMLYKRLFMEDNEGRIRTRWEAEIRRTSLPRQQDYYSVAPNIDLEEIWKTALLSCSEREQGLHMTSIHVFALADIFGRPIIVFSDDMVDEYTPNGNHSDTVSGIYLPVLRGYEQCEKSPILLCYSNGIFSPLLSSENRKVPFSKSVVSENAYHCVPVQYENGEMMQIHFLSEIEQQNARQYLDMYLNMEEIVGPANQRTLITFLKFKAPLAVSIELLWALQKVSADPTAVVQSQPYYDIPKKQEMANKSPTNDDYFNSEKFKNYRPEDYTHDKSFPAYHPYTTMRKCMNVSKGCMNFESRDGYCTTCLDMRPGVSKKKNCKLCSNMINEDSDRDVCLECNKNPVINGSASDRQSPLRQNEMLCNEPNCNQIGRDEFKGKCRNCFTNSCYRGSDAKPSMHGHFPTDNIESRMNGLQLNDHGETPTWLGTLSPPRIENLRSHFDNHQPRFDNAPPHFDNSQPCFNDQYKTEHFSTNDRRSANNSPFHGAYGSNTDNVQEHKFVKNKVLCYVPGCTGTLGSDDKYCDKHRPKNRQVKKSNCIECGIEFEADDDEIPLCETCKEQQLKEPYVLVNRPNETNKSELIGRGQAHNPMNFQDDFSSMASHESENLSSILTSVPEPPRKNQVETAKRDPVRGPSLYDGFDRIPEKGGTLNWQKNAAQKNFQVCPQCNSKVRILEDNGMCLQCTDVLQNTSDGNRPPHNIYASRSDSAYEVAGRMRPEPIYMPHSDPGYVRKSELIQCRNPRCRTPGLQVYGGLCETCYQRNAQQQDIMPNTRFQHPNWPVNQTGYGNPNSMSRHNNMSPPAIPQSSQRFATQQTVECLNPDCQFFGSNEYGGYCSTCFMEKTKEETKSSAGSRYQPGNYQKDQYYPQPVPQQIQQVYDTPFHLNQAYDAPYEFKGNPSKCRGVGCEMFGSPEYNGFCSQCFKDSQLERDSFMHISR